MKNWFTGCTTMQALKERYKTLAKAYHPDLNPEAGDEAMQQINAQYDELPAQAAAYNAAAAYLKPIKCSIDTAMLYAGI